MFRFAPRIWLIALSIPLCHSVASTAIANPVEPENQKQVDQQIYELIKQLGHDEFATREKAQASLERLGLQAFDALYQAQNNDDLEVRMRAQKLVRSMQVNWSIEADPPEVKRILRGYGAQPEAERKNRMDRLSRLSGGDGIPALCRLVRFESSRRLSKQAALLVLNYAVPDDAELRTELSKQISATVGTSARPGAQWMGVFARTLKDPQSTIDDWDALTQGEQETFTQFPERSSREIVRDLLRWQAEMLRNISRHEEAVAVMQRSIDLLDGSPKQLLEMVDWLMQRKAWSVVNQVEQRFSAAFAENPLLLYRLAEVEVQQGNQGKAEEIAEQALKLTPDEPDAHVVAAFELQDRGLMQWAEREYRHVLKLAPEGSLHNLRGRLLLSEMLHDLEKELPAAEVLQSAVDAVEKDNVALETLRNRLGRELGSMQSRMHYFYARHAAAKDDRAKLLEQLAKGVKADPTDADVLIAMFRVPDPTEEWKTETQKRIDTAIGHFRDEISQYEREAGRAPSEPVRAWANRQLASANNQLAWLVGNTVGDYQEALRCSEKSLELRPDTGGYLDTLGRCYFALKDHENAIKTQKRAVALEPHSLQIQRQLEFFEKEAAEMELKPDNKQPEKEPAKESPPQ